MVSFNGNVKVLGYFLSEEERALKRQWSQENHERMMEFKQQLRRNRAASIYNNNKPTIKQNIIIPNKCHDNFEPVEIDISSDSSKAQIHIVGGGYQHEAPIQYITYNHNVNMVRERNYSCDNQSSSNSNEIFVNLTSFDVQQTNSSNNKNENDSWYIIDCEKISNKFVSMINIKSKDLICKIRTLEVSAGTQLKSYCFEGVLGNLFVQ